MQKNKDFRKTANISELFSNFVICKIQYAEERI